MFSRTCEHAIKAMIYAQLETAEGGRVSLRDISAHIESPEAFTAKILQQLSKAGLLVSAKGPGGGFSIPENHNLTLADIVIAIDGNEIFTECAMGLTHCSEIHPCPLHDNFKPIRNDLKKMLESTPISTLVQKLTQGKTHLRH